MKTIEQKARAYDEAIERAKKRYYAPNVDKIPTFANRVIDEIFPELCESEDERTKNEIIAFVEQSIHRGGGTPIPQEQEDRWIAWLEKFKVFTEHDDGLYHFENNGFTYVGNSTWDNVSELEKQDEKIPVVDFKAKDWYVSKVDGKIHNIYHSVDNVKPKFKVGDWITDGNITIQIEAIKNDCYLYCGDCALYSTKTADKVYHLWTIQDAKPGDVLAAQECYVIFKEIDGLNIKCYCTYHYMNNPSFHVDTLHNKDAFHPATKEQRNTLMKATTDAGYIFDFEKKELKKIEEKNLTDFESAMMHIGESFFGQHAGLDPNDTNAIKKQANLLLELVPNKGWSEEDEYMLNETIQHLKELIEIDKANHCGCDVQFYQRDIDWLQFLKDRYTWKPSDVQMQALKEACDKHWEPDGLDPLYTLYEQLKKLKG